MYIPTTYELLANGCLSSSGAVEVNLKGGGGQRLHGDGRGTCSPQERQHLRGAAAQGFVLPPRGCRTACADVSRKKGRQERKKSMMR